MFIPDNAYTDSPEPVTHAYGESPISSRGNLYYSQKEVDESLSKGQFEGAKKNTKYIKKGMESGHSKDEQYHSGLPIYFLHRSNDRELSKYYEEFYDTTEGRIRYLNENERKKYEINIKDGITTINGKTLNTMGAEHLNALVDPTMEHSERIKIKPVITDTWIFVMDPNGSIYAADWVEEYKKGGYYDALRYYGPAPKEIIGFNHSSLVSGEPVASAGEFKVNNGRLELISNKSGHYYPKPVHIYNFMCELRERDPNLSFKNVKLELMASSNRFAPGVFFSAEEFFNAHGDLSKCKMLDKDKAKEEAEEDHELTDGGLVTNNITRVPCLAQHENTCGQRAAFNALQLKAKPDDPNAAGEAMADDAALRGIGPMQVDVYDDYVRQRLDGNNGDDIALISSIQRVRDLVNVQGEYPYDQGEQDLSDWAHSRRLDVVTLVTNTKVVGEELKAKSKSKKATYGHYIAIQLVRKNKGAPDEKVSVYYADSLVAGQSREDLIKELLRALTPAPPP